ncbi:MAG: HipA domain-containing protein [Prosthecobacter sp.]|uniref:HipA domain-containing protein n=1 Tax=Prosthecobacter sp. TaxID=1965333 RepID=UPI003BB14E97
MSSPYPVWTIERPAEEILEQMGSKAKFWLEWEHPGLADWWLFKFSRENTGEHWSEKIAAEVAALLEIPHAQVELARCDGRSGCLQRSFVHSTPSLSLVHGNEVLGGTVAGYERTRTFHHNQHTFALMVEAFRMLFPDEFVHGEIMRLASYLVLDALVVNTDRHHENWGLLLGGHGPSTSIQLAPTYDHASSLGRELLAEKREAILREKRVEKYVRGARGAIFLSDREKHGANPLGLVEQLARERPQWFQPTLSRLAAINQEALLATVDRVPSEVMTGSAKLLAREILCYTSTTLCELIR